MKLTYWIIECERDSDIFSLVAKTKKEVLRKYIECEFKEEYSSFLEKRVIEYADAFDLLEMTKYFEFNAHKVVRQYRIHKTFEGKYVADPVRNK